MSAFEQRELFPSQLELFLPRALRPVDLRSEFPAIEAAARAIAARPKVGRLVAIAQQDELGFAGEFTYAAAYGLPVPSRAVFVGGDDGSDIAGVEIKTVAAEQRSRSLIVYPHRPRPPIGFALCAVDRIARRGWVLGRISTRRFYEIATRKDFGYGPRLAVDEAALDFP